MTFTEAFIEAEPELLQIGRKIQELCPHLSACIPNLPFELLRAVSDGRAKFIDGVGLPVRKDLTHEALLEETLRLGRLLEGMTQRQFLMQLLGKPK